MFLLNKVYAYANPGGTPPVHEKQLYLTAPQAAQLLGVSREALWRFKRDSADFPIPRYFTPKSPRFSRAEILAWAESKKAS